MNAPAGLLDRPVDVEARNTRPRFSGPKHRPNRRSRRARAKRCKARSTTTRYDRTKSFVFLNNRHYDPTVGIFVSVDPLVTMTMEPYIYGAANPITISDPTGLCGCEDFDIRNSSQPYTDRSDNTNTSNGIWSNPNHGSVPSTSGFIYSVGRYAAGVTGTPGRLIEESGSALLHPIQTLEDLRHVLTNPVETFKAAWHACTGSAQGAGECTGDAIVAALTGKASAKWLDGPCSFSGETEVVMADGSTKPISEVEIGDAVLAFDPETGERGSRLVGEVFVHDDVLVDLVIGGETVGTTEDHPFWNHTDGVFERADRLDPGDLVLSAGGDLVAVEGVVPGSGVEGTAFNLHVLGIHTYFVVVGDSDVLVHNRCPSRSNYRELFREQNPSTPTDYQIHHGLPQKYDAIMQDAGINIHENQFLRGVDPKIHSQITTRWQRWERSLGRTPTAQDVTNFSYVIDEQFGQYLIFGSV